MQATPRIGLLADGDTLILGGEVRPARRTFSGTIRYERRTNLTTQREAPASDPDLVWYVNHLEDLRAYGGKWIAILDERVVASATTAGALVDDLVANQVVDALVTQVPDDTERSAYLIA